LWMTPAYVYRILSVFGVSLYNSFRVTPVIFGVLTVLFLYLAVLRLYGREEAFLSSLFLTVLFGHVFRSMAGYYRGDNYMLFWYSVSLFGVSLALSSGRRNRRRLLFYTIPLFASGLAAAFWQAYYPIFAFLLGSALTLALGAFILRENAYFEDALTLTASTAFGALLANSIGGHLNYGMVGADRWLGREFAKEFGLHFGLIRDAFLLAFLRYAVPAAIATIMVLMMLSRFVRGDRWRLLIAGIGLAAAMVVGLRYYGRVDTLIHQLFPTAPIAETQRTTFSAAWTAYSAALLMVPAFFLSFTPERIRMRDFFILGLLLVVGPMVFLWTRFLFMGSIAVALTAGIGSIRLYESLRSVVNRKRVGSLLLASLILLVPLVTATQGVQNTLDARPFVNGYWVKGLTYLGEHSNINDVIITWWDHGHWVTYYANRAPVAQGSPNRWVAQYYLGLRKPSELMARGVDYVTVSYDTLLKFGAVLETAGVSPADYGFVLMPLSGRYGNVLMFSNGGYSILLQPGRGAPEAIVRVGASSFEPKELYLEAGNSLRRFSTGRMVNQNAYVYVNLNYGYAVLMNTKTFKTPLARLMFTDNLTNYSLVYSDGGILKIFRFNHPNVVVTAENGSVVLKFTNATGTGLGIYGFLDNGTLVFKKWYGVHGKNEFILPENLNGSVVVRYTYVRKKTVLDRGVFRIEDVLSGAGN
uniref:STT3 domain-containing protein n=1 Tax=Thermococcus sp. TaxID=35749 RepID=UPI00260DA35F